MPEIIAAGSYAELWAVAVAQNPELKTLEEHLAEAQARDEIMTVDRYRELLGLPPLKE